MEKEIKMDDSIAEKLDRLIALKKEESSALKKIFESFELGKPIQKEKPNQKK